MTLKTIKLLLVLSSKDHIYHYFMYLLRRKGWVMFVLLYDLFTIFNKKLCINSNSHSLKVHGFNLPPHIFYFDVTGVVPIILISV